MLRSSTTPRSSSYPAFFAVAVAGNDPGLRRSIQSVPRQTHRLSGERHCYVCYLTEFPFAVFDSKQMSRLAVEVLLSTRVQGHAGSGNRWLTITRQADGLTDLPSERASASTRPEQDLRRR